MNVLSRQQRLAIMLLHQQRKSARAIERITGIHRNTICNLIRREREAEVHRITGAVLLARGPRDESPQA